MDDLVDIFERFKNFRVALQAQKEEAQKNLTAILHDQPSENIKSPLKDTTNLQPEKKRPKRLTALDENDDDENSETSNSLLTESNVASNAVKQKQPSPKRSQRSSSRNAQKSKEDAILSCTTNNVAQSASELMPPPVAPTVVSSSISDTTYSRPQRAAKLDCSKHLKEQPLNRKLRRPDGADLDVKIKMEQEQRPSQMHADADIENRGDATAAKTVSRGISSTASGLSQDSVVALPAKELSTYSVSSEGETITTATTVVNDAESSTTARNLRVRVKREKMSTSMEKKEATTSAVQATVQSKDTEATTVDFSTTTSGLSTTEAPQMNTTETKKSRRKKKFVPKPIKVERLSEADGASISSRTRNRSKDQAEELSSDTKDEEAEKSSNCKDKNGSLKNTSDAPAAVNETVIMTKQALAKPDSTMILGAAPNDATYCTAAGAATFVLEAPNAQTDLTFNVANEKATESQHSSMQSMETARDTLQPNSDSIMTEDESYECAGAQMDAGKKNLPQVPIAPNGPSKPTAGIEDLAKALPAQRKPCKMPARTIEIFNPLVQSPVKKKVEAYENVAAAQAATAGGLKRTRSKQNALNLHGASALTPSIGKLKNPTLGRFLTPNSQSSTTTITPNVMAQSKKVPASASKVQTVVKSSSAGNLKSMVSSSAKAPSRENSGDDFRKGLHQMAEERKKQREQKHLLAAQQREAKERERAERLAKAAQEREEKRLKKQQEAEQRKGELEEIQKKLREQEAIAAAELAKQKAKALMAKESHGAKPKIAMPPPQPKTQKKYTFEMLHEDDSTDDENKTTYKRPPPPLWSRSHVRGPTIEMQQFMPTDVVDSFFSVQPMTPDLQEIFPAIDPRYLKRNSSAVWATPPRYSELPKY